MNEKYNQFINTSNKSSDLKSISAYLNNIEIRAYQRLYYFRFHPIRNRKSTEKKKLKRWARKKQEKRTGVKKVLWHTFTIERVRTKWMHKKETTE